jgi:hypothetical protein
MPSALMRAWHFAAALALVSCAEDAQPSTQSQDGARASPPDFSETGTDGAAFALDPSEGPSDAGPPQMADSAAQVTAPRDADTASGGARASLVLPELWAPLDPASDPFDDQPPLVSCSWLGVMPETLSEERVLGVDTGGCNYLSAVQPTQRAVAAGETLKVRLWHFELNAPAESAAHAALLVDGLLILNARVPIPSPGGLIVEEVRAERAIAPGAPVHFHLHNHGANTWALVEVSAGP